MQIRIQAIQRIKKMEKGQIDICIKEESRKYFSVCSLKDFSDYPNYETSVIIQLREKDNLQAFLLLQEIK